MLSSASQDGSHLPKKRQNQAMSKNSVYTDTETYFKVKSIDYIIKHLGEWKKVAIQNDFPQPFLHILGYATSNKKLSRSKYKYS